MSTLLAEIKEYRRQELTAEGLERIARRGSIKHARRPGVLAWLRRRLGWQP